MWVVDCEEGWVLKNWCFWSVVLEKTLESPLDCKEIQPVHSERDQPWDFFRRSDAKAKAPVLCPPHAKCWLIGKDCDAERDWGQEDKGTTKDEKAGWHHWLDGRVWVNSGRWWWTGRPGVLQFMGLQRVGHNWVIELNWTVWRLTRLSRMNTPKRHPLHYRGLECKSRKSRDTWSNRQIWPWNTEWSRTKITEFCKQNELVMANTLFQQHKRQLYTWTSPDSQ